MFDQMDIYVCLMIFKYCTTCTQFMRFIKLSDIQETYLLKHLNNFDGIIEYE